ncbi:MAG: hypothetical protein ACI88A_003881 [Paraglaciecola sp.]|jgi:hypothetical protein
MHRRRVQSAESMQPERANIDRQIFALHQAMAIKLIAHPELVPAILETIEQRYARGQMRHGAYLTWSCLMENISDTEVFLDDLLEDSATMRSLRRQSPLVGVLNEEERQAVLSTCIETPK